MAIAIFVIGAAVWRSPVIGYRSSATLVYATAQPATNGDPAAPQGAPIVGQQVVGQVVAVDLIREAEEAASGERPGNENGVGPEVRNDDLRDIKSRLQASVVSGDQEGVLRIAVDYQDAAADRAVTFVNALVKAFVRKHERLDDARRESLAHQCDQAAADTKRLREELKSIRAEQESLRSTPSGEPQPAPADPGVPLATNGAEHPNQFVSTDSREPAEPLNPDWIRLRDHLARLEERSVALSETLTAAHPEMQELSGEIKEFTTILERTPKYIETDPPRGRNAAGPGSRDNSSGTQPQSAPSMGGPLLSPPVTTQTPAPGGGPEDLRAPEPARIQELELACGLAEQRLLQAERRERNLRRQMQQASPTTAKVEVWARTADRIGGVLRLSQVLMLLAIAVAVGAVVSVLAPATPRDAVLRRVADAEQILSVPAVGALSAKQGVSPPAARPSLRRLVARTVTATAELVLVALVVVFLIGIALDHQLVAGYVDDPFEAFHRTIDLTRQRLIGG